MLLSYSDCLGPYKSDYQIKKAIKDKELFKIEQGLYATVSNVTELAIVTCKYPEAIITMNSAFYYHGLTDVIPDLYYLATNKSARALRDKRIKQIFVPDNLLNLGIVKMKKRDAFFNIYDKERMLIELLRYKNKLPYDYYKEIIENYRDIIYELDIPRIEEYANLFPKSNMIISSLRSEVL